MARIYTRTGDRGETALFDGSRTTKSDPRVALYGGVDELSSVLGLARAHLALADAAVDAVADATAELTPLDTTLLRIQQELLALGAILAHPERSVELRDAAADRFPWAAADIEADIDRLQAELPPLKSFVVPGGSALAATLHIARTVCRRVERHAVAAAVTTAVPAQVLVYLNRLSDLLFVAARWANHRLGFADILWPERS